MAEKVLITVAIDSSKAVKDVKKIEKGMDRLGKEADQTTRQLKKTSRTLRQTGQSATVAQRNLLPLIQRIARLRNIIGVLSFAGIFKGLRLLSSAVKLAGIQIITDRRLEQALRNLGDAGPEAVKGINDIANELQRLTNFSNESIQTQAALLASFKAVGSAEGIGLLLPRIADMAAGVAKTTGETIDLNSVTIALGKALEGQTGILRRYGVSLTETQEAALKAASGMERVSLLTEILDGNFKGLAEAMVDPFKQLQNAVGDAMEVLGTELRAELLITARSFTTFVQGDRFLGWLRRVATSISEAIRKTREFREALLFMDDALDEIVKEGPRAEEAMDRFGFSISRMLPFLEGAKSSLDILLISLKAVAVLMQTAAARFDIAFGRFESAARRFANIQRLLRPGGIPTTPAPGALPFGPGSAIGIESRISGLLGDRRRATELEDLGGGGTVRQAKELEEALDKVALAAERVREKLKEIGLLKTAKPGAGKATESQGEETPLAKEARLINEAFHDIVGPVDELIGALAEVPLKARAAAERSFGELEAVSQNFSATIGQALGGLSNLFHIAGVESKAFFEVSKAVAIASAIISSYEAAAKALGKTANPLVAAGILTAGLALVAIMQSTTPETTFRTGRSSLVFSDVQTPRGGIAGTTGGFFSPAAQSSGAQATNVSVAAPNVIFQGPGTRQLLRLLRIEEAQVSRSLGSRV